LHIFKAAQVIRKNIEDIEGLQNLGISS